MKTSKALLSALLLTGTLGLSSVPVWAQAGILFKAAATADSNYCHIRFPAIREETLYSNRPVLKDPSSGDIVDFYGSCSHDPLEKEEVQAQRLQYQHMLSGAYSSD